MASFTKRPNGSYQGVVYVGRDENGKQIRRTVTRQTLKECKAAVREIERELEDKNYSKMMNVGIVAWIDEWIELNKNRLARSTYPTYKLYSRVHYKPFFKKMKLGELTDIHIMKFMAHQLERVSVNTVRKHMSVLNRILEDALKDKNPARYVKLPSKKKFEPRVPTRQEFETLHNTIRGTLDEIIVLLAAWCGLRRGEIFALKSNDIFKNRRIIKVDESYTIDEEYDYDVGPPKSDNGYREVAVPKYLMNLLQKHIKNQMQEYTRKQQENPDIKEEPPERLFELRPDYYSERFHNLLLKYNERKPPEEQLPLFRFHDLRHYHATWLYHQRLPDHYAAKRLGHDIQTLKRIYQHLGLDDKERFDDDVRQTIDQPPKAKKYKIKRTMQK